MTASSDRLISLNRTGFLSNTEYSISLPLLLSAISTPFFLLNCLRFSPPMSRPTLRSSNERLPSVPKTNRDLIWSVFLHVLNPDCLQLYSNSQMQLGQSLSFHKNSQLPLFGKVSPCKYCWNIFLPCKYVLIVIGVKDSSVPVSVDVCRACIESKCIYTVCYCYDGFT